MSDLDQLAAAGRAKREAEEAGREAKQAQREAPAPKRPEQSADERRRMLNAVAFNTAYASVWSLLIGSFGWLIVGMLAARALGVQGEMSGAVGGGVAAIWGFVWFWGLRRLALRRERRWLLARPYSIAADRLLTKLGKARDKTKVRIVVEFRGPLDGASRKLLREAGEGVHPEASARFEQGALVISAQCQSKRSSRPGSSSSDGDPYQNEAVYRFIRTVLREGVEAMHAQLAVERVRVELSG